MNTKSKTFKKQKILEKNKTHFLKKNPKIQKAMDLFDISIKRYEQALNKNIKLKISSSTTLTHKIK